MSCATAEGQTVKGKVKKIMPFAFVDIGGVDGLVHVSDLSHERVNMGEERGTSRRPRCRSRFSSSTGTRTASASGSSSFRTTLRWLRKRSRKARSSRAR